MRDKLNSNPVAQIGLIAILLIVVGYFVMSSMGGEEGEEASSGEVAATVNGVGATGSSPGEAVENAVSTLEAGATASTEVPPVPMETSAPPAEVTAAYESGDTVTLLFVHDGGIDDGLVRDTTARLGALPGVATFVVPAERISRYAAITQGLGVDRVPALVVVRPKRVDQAVPTASVSYGFQNGESVVQAVIDAGYEGPTVDYHP